MHTTQPIPSSPSSYTRAAWPADRVYPHDMVCRVAWRTGWLTYERMAKAVST